VCSKVVKKSSRPKDLDKHYGLRALCTVIVWIVLGATLEASVNQNTFFSALILFLLPLSLDYNAHMPLSDDNKKWQNVGLWSTLGLVAIFVGIIFSGRNVEFLTNNTWVKNITWLLCIFYVYLSFRDWVAYSSPEETAHRERIKRAHRERTGHEPMAERVHYYKQGKEPTGTSTE
jgi:hypothetical protein